MDGILHHLAGISCDFFGRVPVLYLIASLFSVLLIMARCRKASPTEQKLCLPLRRSAVSMYASSACTYKNTGQTANYPIRGTSQLSLFQNICVQF